jgi:UDP-2-acetamido-2,6-beta-L-arabino-hexul-4-ose reductase
MKLVVTGASGLLGWHASVRLHARNCEAIYRGDPEPFNVVRLDHLAFADPAQLRSAMVGVDAILHFAGVNRAPDDEVERGNLEIAAALLAACRDAGVAPHIVYANSIHAAGDTAYGRGKRRASEMLAACPGSFTNLVLPHIFGECARPHYNNVTATFINQVIAGGEPRVNADGKVHLLHAGDAAQAAIDAVVMDIADDFVPESRTLAVTELFAKLHNYHALYARNIYPDLSGRFDLTLYNSYRAALYPGDFPRVLALNEDGRGMLFEAVKGGGGGQTFLSWTKPGVTRGNHFHLFKVERFLVLEGEAVIRVRRVLGGPIWEYKVSGRTPAVVDMPTLHTHSIENVGDGPLLTLFWTHDIFDPAAPDTYADAVLEG